MTTHHTDVVVVGGGTMGTAVGWALARKGVRVVVLEQFPYLHSFGSHGGRTRIFRHAYAEGVRYVPWAIEADALWSEVQERSERAFIHRVGCLDISAPGSSRARDAYGSAVQHGIAAEWLNGSDVGERWPIWKIAEDREVCYAPRAGFLDVPTALRALLSEMTAAGGVLRDEAPVVAWSANDSGVRVETMTDTFFGERLVLTAGAWSVHLLAGVGIDLEVRRKPVLWFEIDQSFEPLGTPDRMPVFITDDGNEVFYGNPQFEVPGIKVGMHSGGEVVDPNTIDRAVTQGDLAEVWPFIQRNLRGFTGKLLDAECCMYTMTPDEAFVIDRHPEHERVVFATGFSGHGFKFAPVIGQYLAELSLSSETGVIDEFGIARFDHIA